MRNPRDDVSSETRRVTCGLGIHGPRPSPFLQSSGGPRPSPSPRRHFALKPSLGIQSVPDRTEGPSWCASGALPNTLRAPSLWVSGPTSVPVSRLFSPPTRRSVGGDSLLEVPIKRKGDGPHTVSTVTLGDDSRRQRPNNLRR